jgi:hypothetical protein
MLTEPDQRWLSAAIKVPSAVRAGLAALTWRSVLTTAGIFLASVAGAVLLFEVAVERRLQIRSAHPVPEPPLEQGQPGVRAPGVAQSFEREFSLMDPATGSVRPGGRITETFDQFGMRAGSTHSSFPHHKTVALVGDSFTAGAEVSFHETLQGRLAARFPGVNVLNFGVSGSNSRFYAAQAQGFIERTGMRPHLYVVSLYKDMQFGDIPRRQAVERNGGRVIYRGVQISRAEYERLKDSPLRRASFEAEVFLREHSSTFNVLFPPKPSKDFAVPVLDELTPDRFAKWRADVLKSLRDLGRTSPAARLIVWLVPSNHHLVQKVAAQRRRKPPPVPAWVGLTERFWAEFASHLRTAGFDVIDPTETVEGLLLTEQRGEYPFTATGHFRPVAYEAVAALIEPCLATRLNEAETASPASTSCQ